MLVAVIALVAGLAIAPYTAFSQSLTQLIDGAKRKGN